MPHLPSDDLAAPGLKEGFESLTISGSTSKPVLDAAASLVDSVDAVANMITDLEDLPTDPPSLYVDLEGSNLSRHGSISILQIHVRPTAMTFLVDVHVLGNNSFTTPGQSGRTLQEILEAKDVPKVFFDVRNDSDALFAHFNIRLAGIHDLQLMEVATRPGLRRFVSGLAKCADRDLVMGPGERVAWSLNKEKGLNLFAPERGGSYEVFNERPLPKAIISYCSQDVQVLPGLWSVYNGRLSKYARSRRAMVLRESEARVSESQSPSYQSHGRHKALAPSGW